LSIPGREPVTADFNDRRLAIGLGSFNICSEVGGAATDALPSIEYWIEN
jgi:hypothetical protein